MINKQAAGTVDRVNFYEGINAFKAVLKGHEEDLNRIDPLVRRNIKKILTIEQSIEFKICDLIAEKMDSFFRYFYLACVAFFLGYFAVELDGLWKSLILFFLGMGVLSLQVFVVVRRRMRKSKLTWKGAFLFYLKCMCIHKHTS